MENYAPASLTFGLDIGPNSIGWALISSDRQISSGVRIFPAGLDDLEMDGKGKSRNVERREARGRRRLLKRQVSRLVQLASHLQKINFLPKGDLTDSSQRHTLFENLDKRLASPYELRAKALDQKLEPYELGRALYHLAQRRGFLSNRKSQVKDEKEQKGMKKEISDLGKDIEKAGARTLGEFFSRIDPHTARIRARHTSRKMYEDEFEAIWVSQQKYYPDILTDEFKKIIKRAIFYQRPLKSQSHLIGQCELEPKCKRAPWALLIAQRFRFLQTLNNLLIFDQNNKRGRKLNDDERDWLTAELEKKEKLTFAQVRKNLNLKQAKFNLELDGDSKIIGNRTAAKLIDIFGEKRWAEFSQDERNAAVEDYRSIVKDETLKRRGQNFWGLDEEKAADFGNLSLEDKYCNFSVKAISKLMPLLEKGYPLQTAIKDAYPERFAKQGAPKDSLPPVRAPELPDLRNPIVERSLNELRRVVNALISRYGKPDIIRIELGRSLRQTAKQRENTTKKNNTLRREREQIRERIEKEIGIKDPSRTDIQKVQLAEECNWECPYTGKHISMASLLGDHPQFDIEHIIPFERCLDDSFMNKTLCGAEENRKVKKGRTPYEAYHGTDKWDDIIARIEKFHGDAARPKLRRFELDEKDVDGLLNNFTERQMNDMRWAARRAKQYLGLLYGGLNDDGIDSSGKRRVQAVGGAVTARLRGAWGLNNILGEEDIKTRDDHRHHAVDAIVVAMTSHDMVKTMSDAAKRGQFWNNRRLDDFPQPWDRFHAHVKNAVDNIIVSHRLSRRVRGALHKESFYGTPKKDNKGISYVAIKKPLEGLTPAEVEDIIHPTYRALVKQKLEETCEVPKKAFKDESGLPRWRDKNGRERVIRRVRIRMNRAEVFPVGEGHRTRYVTSDANHHIAIYKTGAHEKEKWDGEVVSLFEAYQRKKKDQPIVGKACGPGRTFLFSLAGGDITQLDNLDKPGRTLYVVRTVPKSKQLYFVPINDARKLSDIGKKGLTARPDSLRERHCRKVIVTPLGEVRDAND